MLDKSKKMNNDIDHLLIQSNISFELKNRNSGDIRMKSRLETQVDSDESLFNKSNHNSTFSLSEDIE